MKIKQVKIYQLDWGPQLRRYWHPVVVKIITDDGNHGWGEAGIAYGKGAQGTVGVLQELAPQLLGRDASQINAIWQDFYEHTFWAKNGGTILYSAISAIDVALWDLKARAFNVPLYQLLGGQIRNILPVYASHLEYGWGPFSRRLDQPSDFARLAKRAKRQGYTAIKVDPIDLEAGRSLVPNRALLKPDQLNRYYQRVAAIRQAVGKNVQIIIDCHANLNLSSAIQLVRKLAPLGIDYYEELLPTLNPAATKRLVQATGATLAVGEHLTIPATYQPYLSSIGIVQPDLGTCGGVTGAQQIIALAATNELGVQLHVCGGPIATAAALQFEAACPNFVIHEEHEINLKAANYNSGKYHYHPVDGKYKVPSRSGIGQELSSAAIAAAKMITIK